MDLPNEVGEDFKVGDIFNEFPTGLLACDMAEREFSDKVFAGDLLDGFLLVDVTEVLLSVMLVGDLFTEALPACNLARDLMDAALSEDKEVAEDFFVADLSTEDSIV